MDAVLDALAAGGFSPRLAGFSALDRYCGAARPPERWVASGADLADLARAFEGLRFPGAAVADAALDDDGGTTYFSCPDDGGGSPSFPVLGFAWDAAGRSYLDPLDVYPRVRALRDPRRAPGGPLPADWLARELDPGSERFRAAADAAVLASRYRGAVPEGAEKDAVEALAAAVCRLERTEIPPPEGQRILLDLLATSKRPELGFAVLKRTGWIDAFWPELASLSGVDHAKEYHPEGDAWEHTLETFRYRKTADRLLTIALLLHDAGKPLAETAAGRRFDRHAELGENAARRFLERLGYPDGFVRDARFLVRNHMLPAALPRLPAYRCRDVLESPLFTTLLELYRCDESSSFKGLGGYFDACAAYRSWLRNSKNPYRSADGKKYLRELNSR